MARYTAAVPRRIGVFGGTFDPPHVGHLVAAVTVAHHLSLDQVLFTVANVPWQKVGSRDISSADDRLRMVELAVADQLTFEPSALEIDRGGDSVTADTLEALHDQLDDPKLFLVLGSDAAAGLPTWRRGDAIPDLADIVIVDRPGTIGDRPPAPFRFTVVDCPLMDISSTDVRARARAGLPIDYLVSHEVRDHIRDGGLYS